MKIDTVSFRAVPETDLFAALTAEAWLDPALARALAEDKAGTIARFAADLGHEVPPLEEIEAFELPENPVGDVEIGIVPLIITAVSAVEDGCPYTVQDSCPMTTQPDCPTTASNCGTYPTYFGATCGECTASCSSALVGCG